MSMRNIVLGHSIAAGFMDPKGGWKDRIERKMNSDKPQGPNDLFKFYNLAVSGFTTSDLRKQIPEELQRRENELDKRVIIQIGMNDPLFERRENKYRVSRDEFRENIRYIIEETRKFADQFYMVGEPPVNVDGVIPWEQSLRLDRQDLLEYEDIKREACIRRGVNYIDLRKHLPDRYEENLADGLHPDGRGHQMIANIVGEKLPESGFRNND